MQHLQCPHCTFLLVDDGTLAGQVVACPNCAGHFQMPGMPMPPPQAFIAPQYELPMGSLPGARPPAQEHKYEYKFGIAHKPKETFQHAFSGSFGVMFGSTLGKALGCFVVIMCLVTGCVALAVIGNLASPKESPSRQKVQRSNYRNAD